MAKTKRLAVAAPGTVVRVWECLSDQWYPVVIENWFEHYMFSASGTGRDGQGRLWIVHASAEVPEWAQDHYTGTTWYEGGPAE